MSKTDRDLDNEIAAHLAEAVDDYVARGRQPKEARLGGAARLRRRHSSEASASRDAGVYIHELARLQLGGRMLVKYPGLTVVGGFAMAFAILVGIVIFQFAGSVPLPFSPARERRSHRRN